MKEFIPVCSNYLTNLSCERCNSEYSWQVTLCDSIPAHLCDSCRRDFQKFIMQFHDYKALCATKIVLQDPINESKKPELFSLYYDIQFNLIGEIESWFKNV